MTTIVWFRQDLRTTDNPALAHAAARGKVLPVYILEDSPPPPGRRLGGASRWWLHHSLAALRRDVPGLVLLAGDPRRVIPDLVAQTRASSVVWNRCYEPHAIARDTEIKAALAAAGIDAASFNASLLHEPWEIETGSGGPFKVYTPFWKAARQKPVPKPLPAPRLAPVTVEGMGLPLAELALTPAKPDWAAGWQAIWSPGEAGAQARLDAFLKAGLSGYGERRNRPDLPHVSRLSPHLHFGEISPRLVWHRTEALAASEPSLAGDAAKFLSEVGWREFAYHLLYHFPTLPDRNWKPAFDAYPWVDDPKALVAWQRGRTGYPMVDAGMRELWATGYMHNRVRMIAASFLVKHLRIDWRHGERWFWETLLDADLANNAAGWQWVAGSGADAAPYFRIFNPIEQGRKFDPTGNYVRRWCPELARLPDAVLHAPFAAPAEVLAAAGVTLGDVYPHPIVDHQTARRAALAGYEAVKEARSEH
ncbi:MAG: deoxyribodipyrimidine photo-lyase [Hyphomicrobiaceae bacterium]